MILVFVFRAHNHSRSTELIRNKCFWTAAVSIDWWFRIRGHTATYRSLACVTVRTSCGTTYGVGIIAQSLRQDLIADFFVCHRQYILLQIFSDELCLLYMLLAVNIAFTSRWIHKKYYTFSQIHCKVWADKCLMLQIEYYVSLLN